MKRQIDTEKIEACIREILVALGDDPTREGKGLIYGVGIPVDEKILRIIGGNADALHSRVKLLRRRRQRKPRAA